MELMEQGHAKVFVDRKDVAQFNNVAYDILTTTSSYAQRASGYHQGRRDGVAQALNFMRNHPDETLALEQKHFPKLSKTVLQQSLQFIPLTKDGMQSQQGLGQGHRAWSANRIHPGCDERSRGRVLDQQIS